MKRTEFIRLLSLGGITLIAVPSCTDLNLAAEDALEGDALSQGEQLLQSGSPFNSKVGARIPVANAKAWTQKFNQVNDAENLVHLNKDQLMEMISADDCQGISFQFALDDFEKFNLILTRVNSESKTSEDQLMIAGSRNETLFS